jgi:tetratricopeptide (TPR) repeat protein
VAQVQGLSERQVLHHLSHELGPRVHRLVREAGEVALDHRFAARYQFGHALFQAYLYSTLTGGERRLLHGEVAAALEELYGQHTDAIAPALAHHYQAAGSLAQAAAYATRAGELAYAAYAYVEAGKHHRTALELYREVGDRAKEAAALEELSSAYNCMGAIAEIEKCRQNALAIYRELGDRDGEARILRRLGWIRVFTSKYDQAEPYFLQAVQIWREIGEPHAATKALHGLGRFHREHTGNFVRAKAYAQETLRLSLESGDRYGEAMGKFSIGFALYYQGDYSAADPYMRGAVQLLGEPGWLDDCACCLIGVGLNAIALGNYAMARAHLQESRSMFREARTDDLDDDGWAQSALALLYHQQDEDQTACDQARRALRIHRTFGHRYRQAFALVHLGHSLVGLGRLEEATDAYKQALDLRREMGHRHLVSEPLAGMARVALALDDPAAALVYVEEILSHLETRSVDGTDEPLRIYLTCYRVLRANGDPRADEVLETAHCLLQERAAKIEDEEVRRSFLENVAAHRELASEWHAVGRDGSTRP